ncbi:uncharacterized protein BX664DRAFT_303356 [Halteromyces radiatus]|uniref:uncharacterized protein n=1 Tax=Halteromyces radiatus TaxID=101107 RepID=UPI00221F710A|nr:uncharacterized protein BX664DRAFT_303356 [Halteromyces radiatus]KAI8078645.1 hypothetical protein BX664DRAFT_303356 [Halteromyces radiatus]
MAKGRSAISKAMGKKKTSESHVSGLSTSKPSTKRKEAPTKFGNLSRKDKQQLLDYGELVPTDFAEDELDEQDSEQAKRRRRVVNEEDLDREMEEQRRRDNGELVTDDETSEEGEEEEDWEKPSAYSLLMGSLKKTSKNQDFYKKIQLEQEGLEDIEEEYEQEIDSNQDDESDEMEDMDEEDDTNLEQQDDDVYDHDDMEPTKSDNEQEEEEEEEIEIGYISSDDEEELRANIYEDRFKDHQPTNFDEKIAYIEQKKWTPETWQDDELKDVVSHYPDPTTSIKDTKKKSTTLEEYQVKEKVARHWKTTNKSCVSKGPSVFTPLQESLFEHINKYRDIMFSNRSITNAKEIRNLYALHAVNHITKTRDRVMKNNAKIQKAHKENKDPGEYRDQGFTRPKVLIVLPFRNTVIDVVESLIKLSGSEQQENKKRFYDQFSLLEEDKVDDSKPADFKETFKGNIDDHFRLGIKFTKKSMKLFSDFYHSDILIASPLGLRTLIGSEGDKKRDHDYLSSIEIMILDQTTHFLMQNWEHIDHIFQHMNLIPNDAHGCDISRIKNWYLDGKGRYLRQTLVFADFLTPELNALYNKYMKNITGKLKIKQSYEGTIMDVTTQVPQSFTRIDTTSLAAMDDARFKFFVEKTLPSLRRSAMMQSHTLFFIPSYFDFVRIRNYLEDNKYDYEPCCEYTSGGGIARARAQFFHGRTNFILYTERLHFFRRYNIRGTYHVVFYGLPDHASFYAEVVDFLGLKINDQASAAEEATFSCTALFSKYDFLKLERIVGSERAKNMCTAQKNVFYFQ